MSLRSQQMLLYSRFRKCEFPNHRAQCSGNCDHLSVNELKDVFALVLYLVGASSDDAGIMRRTKSSYNRQSGGSHTMI